jgi:hypothetical protein
MKCFPAGASKWTSTAVLPPKRGGDGGNGAQKRAPVQLPDEVSAKKKSSTPNTSDRSNHKITTNANLPWHSEGHGRHF